MKLPIRIGPAALAMLGSAAVLVPLYLATAAPDLTFWDAPEFMTAAHTLGIPHPPGTPMWVLTAKSAALAFASHGPARAVTLLSVVATVLACALGARLVVAWMHGRFAAPTALAAAIAAGTMTSVWANATETEVYALSLLLAVSLISAGDYAGQAHASPDAQRRGRALVAFLAGLAVPLHLSALVALPAAVVLAWHTRHPRVTAIKTSDPLIGASAIKTSDPLIGEPRIKTSDPLILPARARVRARDLLLWILLALLGLSAVAVLPIRASFSPELNTGNPVDLPSLWAVLTRAQYAVAGLWPRRAPLWIQFGNLFEWADWQVALGLHPAVGPSIVRTPITVLWGWLALLGLRELWRGEKRVGRGVAVLLLSGTLGVVVWLNLRAGPSFGDGVLAPGSLHEARERDYFFALGFWTWGLLAGVGIASVAARLTLHMTRNTANAVRTAMLAVVAVPIVANAGVMNRNREPESLLPRMLGRMLLESVPLGGVLVTAGDNDTYPLLYLQQVEQLRADVTIVTAPLLGAKWHRAALAKRGVLPPGDLVEMWNGAAPLMAAIGQQTHLKHRPLRVSVYLSATERKQLLPDLGWMLQGVVYAPSADVPAGRVGLDVRALAAARGELPPSFLKPLTDFDDTASLMQRLLRCTTITTLQDPLLAGPCNGG